MLSLRLLALFIHVTSVIVALGGSLFSTFALTPVLAQELEPAMRIRVLRRVIRRLGAIVLIALGVLVATGFVNTMYVGFGALLGFKLLLVVIVFLLAFYQYLFLGARIWRQSASGPSPELADLLPRFRRVGLTVGTLVLLIVYLSLGLTRIPSFTLIGVD
jgi:uncharacterized membrane protein